MKISGRLVLWIILASATLTVMAGSMLAPVVNLVRDGLGVDPMNEVVQAIDQITNMEQEYDMNLERLVDGILEDPLFLGGW